MNVARHLVQGVDIWLNNPRRPLEASGTSGMKASFNGSPNFSVLDGWWREGYDGTNGWPIGEEREYSDLAVQDDADAYSLYHTLENDIVPRYYGHLEGQASWAHAVRRAIETCSPRFSMQRQVIDYVEKYYMPLAIRGAAVVSDNDKLARDIATWKTWVRQQWPYTTINAQANLPATAQPGQTVQVTAQVHAAGIRLEELVVQAVLSRGDQKTYVPLISQGDGNFKADVPLTGSGLYSFGVRMIPETPGLSNPLEAGLIKWA